MEAARAVPALGAQPSFVQLSSFEECPVVLIDEVTLCGWDTCKLIFFFFEEEARPQVETEGMPLPQPPGSAASKVVTREKDRKRA